MLITNAYVDAIRELIKSNKTEEIETRHRRRSKYLFMLYTGRELELSHNKKVDGDSSSSAPCNSIY